MYCKLILLECNGSYITIVPSLYLLFKQGAAGQDGAPGARGSTVSDCDETL